MNIGKSIKLALVHQEKTQTELAATIGVSRAYMSTVANNQKAPNLMMVATIAGALDMTVSNFIALGEG